MFVFEVASRRSVAGCREKWCWRIIPQAGQGKNVYRTYGYCLNGHGTKGRGDGPMADSLTPRPAEPASETMQKKSEKELLTTIRDGNSGTSMS